MITGKALTTEEITGVLNETFPLLPQEKQGLRQVLEFLKDTGYDMRGVLFGRVGEGGTTLLIQAVAWDSLMPGKPTADQIRQFGVGEQAAFPARVAVVLEAAYRALKDAADFRSFLNKQYFGHSAKWIARNARDQGVDEHGIHQAIIRLIEHYEELAGIASPAAPLTGAIGQSSARHVPPG